MKYNKNCLHCYQEFERKRSTATYCSDSCRQMTYMNRLDANYKRGLLEEKSFLLPVTVNINRSNRN